MDIWCCICECSAMCFNSQFQIPNALTSAAQCSTGAKCIANPGHPDVFREGAFIASACKKCAPDNSSCLECWEMYGVNKQGECVKCPEPNCYTCDPAKNASICFKCGDFFGYSDVGYYATLEGRCAECLTPDCLECEQLTGRCTQCPAGMGAMPDGGCQPCRDDNCASWDGDPEVCKECLPASFIDPKSKRCISCGDPLCETWVHNTTSGRCQPCGLGCTDCSKGAEQCASCDLGYTLQANGTCSRCQAPNCLDCVAGSTTKCQQCSTPFGADQSSGDCVACRVHRCQFCGADANSCDTCQGGYLYDEAAHECRPCLKPHCGHCSSSGGEEVCDGCKSGYRLIDSNDPLDRRCIFDADSWGAVPAPAPAPGGGQSSQAPSGAPAPREQ